jgi:muramoyltetrapeptide carboxypeptidase
MVFSLFSTTIFFLIVSSSLMAHQSCHIKENYCMQSNIKTNKIIDVIAPSGANITQEQFKKSIDYFTTLGYQVRVPEGLIDSSQTIFHAHCDEKRIEHTKNALLADDSDIIWCLRGGYGTAKVVEGLLATGFKPRKEKVIVGFSDITALHLYCNQQFGWHTIHGACFFQADDGKIDSENITQILNLISNPEKQSSYELKLIGQIKPDSSTNGILSGGNLSIIQTSLATPWQIEGKDKILIIEDCNERGYRIDRMLHHLLHAGVLNKIKALICNFTGGNESDGNNYTTYALTNFAKQVSFPVFMINAIGHDRVNKPFVYGRQARIITNEDGYQLVF